jgi:hypothetical protein
MIRRTKDEETMAIWAVAQERIKEIYVREITSFRHLKVLLDKLWLEKTFIQTSPALKTFKKSTFTMDLYTL